MRALLCLACLAVFAAPARADDFREEQMKNARVKHAAAEKGAKVKQLFLDKQLSWPPAGVLLRIFKEDQVVELWGKEKSGAYVLVQQYPVCANSGVVGPKRHEGDLQVPEGFYAVNHYNPTSQYHLALGVDYPNASDRILGGKGPLGGQIYVHGKCCTIGCVPIQDDNIEEVYLAALEAHAAGQSQVPIHIFPTRLTEEAMQRLAKEHAENAELITFWQNLKEGYDLFDRDHTLPRYVVDPKGRYKFSTPKPTR